MVTKRMGDRYVLGCAPALGFLRSSFLCRLYKSSSDETINPVCIRMQKDYIRMLKILQSMSEFGGLWKHPNNPACTKSVRVFRLLKLDTIQKKKKCELSSVLTCLRVLSDRPRLNNRQAQAKHNSSFDRRLYRTYQNHFLSVNSRSPKGTR